MEPQGSAINIPDQLASLGFKEFPFLVPLPQPNDDLETTVIKMHNIAEVLASGGHITPQSKDITSSVSRKHDAESFAKERMSTMERALYEQWQNTQLQIPDFDWTRNVMRLPSEDAQSLKTFAQRAEAMDILWCRKGASPENALWLSSNMDFILPLIKAITKVLNAQQHLEAHDPLVGLSSDEVAELEVLRLIRAMADAKMAQERERVRKLGESLALSLSVVRGRLESLQK
ncbi:hypothetical protein N7510_000302 [Penicillium lagena]|uniref:uncharacterized protein n=1 Tax=Penicillium lagena TaxID=94218 RepID=UPI002542636A|nr:uncharacterized protein N7510_000302 [Penicillium lagena]KAJ5623993.1 hypothetical protein N7510_000302 [Penicillium lagena]